LARDLLANRGDHDISVRPFEKLNAKEIFDLADLCAESRLADVTGIRRFSEMPPVRHRDQVLEIPQREGGNVHSVIL